MAYGGLRLKSDGKQASIKPQIHNIKEIHKERNMEMKTNWEFGQKILCVSLEDEDEITIREMKIGKTYVFSHTDHIFKGNKTLCFSGCVYIHPVKNFISLPDEIDRKASS